MKVTATVSEPKTTTEYPPEPTVTLVMPMDVARTLKSLTYITTGNRETYEEHVKKVNIALSTIGNNGTGRETYEEHVKKVNIALSTIGNNGTGRKLGRFAGSESPQAIPLTPESKWRLENE